MNFLINTGALVGGLMSLLRNLDNSLDKKGIDDWLIGAAIETVIISLIIAGVISLFFDGEFNESFRGSFIVIGIIEIIVALIYSCS